LALKWILMHKEVTVVIPGAKNKMQVEKNLMASEKEDISEIISKINLVYNELIMPDVQGRW
jgi:aryl-alcohol dehydrogenase-like predicted oxidoreductase